MATMAESPPVRYSKLSIDPESSQPLPVVVATSRFPRANPPARPRPPTASLARPPGSPRGRAGGGGAGIGPDRLGRRRPGERGDLGARGAGPGDGPPLAAERLPGH